VFAPPVEVGIFDNVGVNILSQLLAGIVILQKWAHPDNGLQPKDACENLHFGLGGQD
jgi:hypothetical protein